MKENNRIHWVYYYLFLFCIFLYHYIGGILHKGTKCNFARSLHSTVLDWLAEAKSNTTILCENVGNESIETRQL